MSFHLIMDIACFPSSRNDGVGMEFHVEHRIQWTTR
jgi:hypothetical protein